MFKKLYDFWLRRQMKAVTKASDYVIAANYSVQHALSLLEKSQKNLNARQTELKEFQTLINVDLENAKRNASQYEATIQELREKNTVLQGTIDSLVASHKLLLSRYEAEIAIEVKRKLVTTVSMGD